MDCEKFDLHAIDALYEELDELTTAAMKRHMDGCARCSDVMSGFKATREVGLLPIEQPSDDFEARILEAADVVQQKTPWPRRIVRGIAWAGSQAMRPQLAAVALLVLILGSSLLLLRPKPGSVGASPVSVTERGVPAPEEADKDKAQQAPAALAAAAATAAPIALASAAAPPPMADPGNSADDSSPAFGKAGKSKADSDALDAPSALAQARALREKSGCDSALGAFDKVGATFPGTAAASDAMWDAASCYKAAGNSAKARELFAALAQSGRYRVQAQQELADAQAQMQQNAQVAGAAPRAAGAAHVAAAAAPMPAPAPAKPRPTNQADPGGGSPRVNSAPAKRAAESYLP